MLAPVRSKTDKWRRKNNVVAKTPNFITVVVQVKRCLPVTKSSAPLWMGAVSNPTEFEWSRKGQPYCFARQRRPQEASAAKKKNGVPTPPRKCDEGFTSMGQTWGLARSQCEHGLYSLNLNLCLC